MNRSQVLTLAFFGTLLFILYFFLPTRPELVDPPASEAQTSSSFDIQHYIEDVKASIDAELLSQIAMLENQLFIADISQKPLILEQLADIYLNEIGDPVGYTYYLHARADLLRMDLEWEALGAVYANLFESAGIAMPIKEYLIERGVAIYDSLLVTDPGNENYLTYRANCFANYDDIERGMEIGVTTLLDLVAQNDSNAIAHLCLAKNGIRTQQFDKAIIRLEKVVSLQPANWEGWYLLGIIQEQQGMFGEAISSLETSKLLREDLFFQSEIDKILAEIKAKI